MAFHVHGFIPGSGRAKTILAAAATLGVSLLVAVPACSSDPNQGETAADVGAGQICQTDDECDNGNPCMLDWCQDGICAHKVHDGLVGAPCDDGNPCTEDESCAPDGSCGGGAPFVPASLPCQTCACDPGSGVTCVPWVAGAACDDGDCCTTGDECVACSPGADEGCPDFALACLGATKDCGDGEQCTEDTCKCADGGEPSCENHPFPDGTPCDENPNVCTDGDACQAGVCVPGPPASLSDDNPCTADKCVKGVIIHDPINDPDVQCDDDDECTQDDYCYLGNCVGGPPPICETGPCVSSASCVSGQGCVPVWQPVGTVCDDEDPCTAPDMCDGEGMCKGSGNPCDGPCDTGVCVPIEGGHECEPSPDGEPCDDGDPATTVDQCFDGECVGSCNSGCAGTGLADASSSGHVMTANGDATLSSGQAKFCGESLLVDGNNDSLSAPNDSGFNFGTDPFTIDFWIHPLSPSPSHMYILGASNPDAGTGWDVRYFPNDIALEGFNGWAPSHNAESGGDFVPVGVWTHVAVIGTGSDVKIYIDGIERAATGNQNVQNATMDFRIGERPTSFGGQDFHGYIQEVRISLGIARWTADFTPPSSQHVADAYDVLLLHLDGPSTCANTGLTDVSSSGHVMTPNGDAALSSGQAKFCDRSLLVDGSNDFLSTPIDSGFDFGGEPFTIDFWLYPLNPITTQQWILGATNPGAGTGWDVRYTDNDISIVGFNGWAPVTNAMTDGDYVPVGAWSHVAVIGTGADVKVYIDGIERAAAGNQNAQNATMDFRIGEPPGSYIGLDFHGYIQEVRISKGIARWTADFTPPTGQHASDAHDVLLLHLDGPCP